MLFYRAALPLSRQTLTFVAGIIRRHRASIGSPWRRLNSGQQALLVLAYLRKGETFAELAAGFEVGTSTARRYVNETVALARTDPPPSERHVVTAWSILGALGGRGGVVADHESSAQQRVGAGNDAFVAGRDVVIYQQQPQPTPSESSSPRVWGNVPARNLAFTGRVRLLAAVREALVSGDRATVHALHGMGGVGKTQIAMEYAHRFRDVYDIVWWVNAENAGLIGQQFTDLGTDLGCAVSGFPVGAVRRTVLAELRKQRNWLLVFDNAENAEDIAAWLPSGDGHVLITSRAHVWDEIAVQVEVDVLDRAESVAMLRGRVRELPQDDAYRVAEAVGDLPLAIAQAAGFMAQTGMAAGEYLDLLKDRTAEILSEGRPGSYPQSLAAVTEITLRRLRDEYPAAAQVALICAFLAPEPLPAEWFTKAAPRLPFPLGVRVTDPIAWRRVLAGLGRSALARVDRTGLVMHRLTQAIIRDQLPGELVAGAWERASLVLAANHPGETRNPGNWSGWASVLPHLLALQPADSTDPELCGLAVDATWYLSRRGDARGASALARRLYDSWSERLGPLDPHVVLAAGGLAEALRGMGHFAEARKLDEANLAWCRSTLGDDHPETLASAHDLAVDLRRLGELEASRRLHEGTLERRRQVLGEDDPQTLQSAGNLAVTLHDLGELEAARKLHEETLAQQHRVLGDDHPSTMASATNLANDLYDLGDLDAARELDEHTLALKRQVLGEDHPDTLISAYNLFTVMRKLGRIRMVPGLIKETVTRFRRVLGDDHPNTRNAALSALHPSNDRMTVDQGINDPPLPPPPDRMDADQWL